MRHAADRRIMTTMQVPWSKRWADHVEEVPCRAPGTPADLWRMWRASRGKEALLLMGSSGIRDRYRDLLLALLVRMLHRRPPLVVLADATWEPSSRALAERTGLPAAVFGVPFRWLVRALDGPHVRYAVLSRAELSIFPQVWGVDPERVVFTPFPATIDRDTPRRIGNYAFAGGDSLRDHDLLEAALGGGGIPTIVASKRRFACVSGDFQASHVSEDEYIQLLAGAGAVVVNLAPSVRSAGQQTYLSAMLLEKPTIVTDAPGVRDYIEHGVTGIVVPCGDPHALREAVRDALDPSRRSVYAEMGRRARQFVLDERLEVDHYFEVTLLALVGVPPPEARDVNPASRSADLPFAERL